MYPILFSLGPFSLRTYGIFLAAAFLLAGFVFWRRGREEHYKEDILFDGFLLSIVVGALGARLGHIAMHAGDFGFAVLSWLDIFSKPGFNGFVGLCAAALYLYRYATQHKWDAFEILDFWATASALGLAVIALGQFFDGAGYGVATTLPWGIIFPGTIQPHHPLQLYIATLYAALFVYLSWVEYRYRTFEWYRYGKKTAQTGFLFAAFLLYSGLVHLVASLLQQSQFVVGGIVLDQVFAVFVFLVGVGMLYIRSGREVPVFGKRKHATLRRFKPN